jgi:hypothetical protein
MSTVHAYLAPPHVDAGENMNRIHIVLDDLCDMFTAGTDSWCTVDICAVQHIFIYKYQVSDQKSKAVVAHANFCNVCRLLRKVGGRIPPISGCCCLLPVKSLLLMS